MEKDKNNHEELSAMEKKYAEWDERAKAEEESGVAKEATGKRHVALLISAIIAVVVVVYRISLISSVQTSGGTDSFEALGRAIGAQLGAKIIRPFLIAVGAGSLVNFYAWFKNNKTATIVAIALYVIGAITVSRLWLDAAIPAAVAVIGLVHQTNATPTAKAPTED